jgi:adiponectin receptor
LIRSATIFFVLSPGYSTPEYRRTRTWLFIGLGLSGVVPTVESLLIYGWAYSLKAFGLDWLLTGGGLYIVGALL